MKCLECERKFEAKTYWQKFCSKECKWKNWDKENPRIRKNKQMSVERMYIAARAFQGKKSGDEKKSNHREIKHD